MARKRARRLQRNVDLIRAIYKAKPLRRKQLVKSADVDLIACLVDCIRNTVAGNIPLSPACHRTITRHKALLRKLSEKKNSAGVKKRILTRQTGGFFGSLIPAILGSVLTAVVDLLDK